MKNILILGANSAIAQATARLWAKKDNSIYLLGRNLKNLKSLAEELNSFNANCSFSQLDVLDLEKGKLEIDKAKKSLGEIDVFFISYGLLDAKDYSYDLNSKLNEFYLNANTFIYYSSLIAEILKKQKGGTIVAMGSVAGDRGKASNYVYGSAKAAVEVFFQGLRQELYIYGVRVVLIKPGPTVSPMTEHMKKSFLWSTPKKVANDINKSIHTKKEIVYTPRYWFFVLFFLKLIPEKFYKRFDI